MRGLQKTPRAFSARLPHDGTETPKHSAPLWSRGVAGEVEALCDLPSRPRKFTTSEPGVL